MAGSASEPIALTGCSWVTPFAAGSIDTVLNAARRHDGEAAGGAAYWAVQDESPADDLDLAKELRSDKGAWITAVALEHARRTAALRADSVAPHRVGLVLGCALAGQLGMIEFADEVREQTARFVSPIHFPQTVGNYVAGALARAYDIRGPNATLSSGIASGLDAIVEGCQLLHRGVADVVFAGGSDSMSKALALGLAEPGVLLSEGACLFVLERAEHAQQRRAAPLATVTGSAHLSTGGQTATGAGNGIVSAAGIGRSGAIMIEHWIGRCFAALGAAAAAAAIGAARGSEIPLSGTADPESVSIGCITVPPGPAPAGIVVVADADHAHVSTVELAVMPGPEG